MFEASGERDEDNRDINNKTNEVMGDCATRSQAKIKLAYDGNISNNGNPSEYITKDEIIAWGGDASYLDKYISGKELVALEDIVKPSGDYEQIYRVSIISTVTQEITDFVLQLGLEINQQDHYVSEVYTTKETETIWDGTTDMRIDTKWIDKMQNNRLVELSPRYSPGVNIFINSLNIVAKSKTTGANVPLVNNLLLNKWTADLTVHNYIEFVVPVEHTTDPIDIIIRTATPFKNI